MLAPRHIFFFLLLIFPAGNTLFAQWKEVPLKSFDTLPGGFVQDYFGKSDEDKSGLGAIAITGHTVWVGVNTLWFSEDTGKKWQKCGLQLPGSSVIHDINFFDRMHGLIATNDDGVLMTTDGGTTWKQILLSTGVDFWKACFNGSPKVIHATSSENGVCFTSRDSGKTWSQFYLGPFVSCMAVGADHTVYVL